MTQKDAKGREGPSCVASVSGQLSRGVTFKQNNADFNVLEQGRMGGWVSVHPHYSTLSFRNIILIMKR